MVFFPRILKLVFYNDSPHLLDRVGLCLIIPWLEIQDLLNIIPRKDMVAPLDPFLESEPSQETAQILKPDIGVRGPTKDTEDQLAVLSHGAA
jgi:hypothetical protein